MSITAPILATLSLAGSGRHDHDTPHHFSLSLSQSQQLNSLTQICPYLTTLLFCRALNSIHLRNLKQQHHGPISKSGNLPSIQDLRSNFPVFPIPESRPIFRAFPNHLPPAFTTSHLILSLSRVSNSRSTTLLFFSIIFVILLRNFNNFIATTSS